MKNPFEDDDDITKPEIATMFFMAKKISLKNNNARILNCVLIY